jgi:hypothetical protein
VLLKKTNITLFKELFWKIKIQQRKEMLSMHTKIPRVKKSGHLLPVLPLIPQKTTKMVEEKEKFIAFGQDARTAEDSQISPISVENVNQALSAVTETVFPHQSLETQRLWMNRKMFKPVELTTRQMAASINRLNNALPFFFTATEASKFSEIELIGLLEWSLSATWRAKFDLDSYIPTLHSRAKLIEACEAIERSEIAVERPSREESSQNHRNIKRSAAKNSTEPQKQKNQNSDGKHYCSEHGYNPTHATVECYTIKNWAKAMNHAPRADKRSFSNQNLRKEINLLAKTSSKKKILEMYASVIKREQAKLNGSKKPEKRRKIVSPESESDDEMSVQVIYAPQKKPKKKTTINTLDVSAEEKKLKWLKDHGELTGEEGSNPREDSSGNDST